MILIVFDKIRLLDLIRLRKFISNNSNELVLHFPIVLSSDIYKNILNIFPFFEYYEYNNKNECKIIKQSISKIKARLFIGQVLLTKFPSVLS